MTKVIVVVLVTVGLLMQFRDEIRGLMGLSPLPGVTAEASAPAISLEQALAEHRQPDVVMYATPTCPYCERARRYMDANGIAFRELNVNTSRRASAEMRAWGGRGVPTIVIDQQDVLTGWNPRSMERTLVAAMLRASGQTH